MNNTSRRVYLIAGLVVLALVIHHVGDACPNCYGDPNSSMTAGMNMAIVSLLGITGSVLALFAGFFVFLRRRFRSINQQFVNRSN